MAQAAPADVKATTKSSPKKKASAAGKMAKKPVDHPKYGEMVHQALAALKERGGSSRQAVLKYIMQHFKVGGDENVVNTHLKIALRAGVKNASLKQSKGSGASGSFRIGEEAKKPKAAAGKVKKAAKASPAKAKKPAKPKAAGSKSPKKAVKKTGAAAKKPVAAKAVAAPKAKADKPKKAASPKKVKVAKPAAVKKAASPAKKAKPAAAKKAPAAAKPKKVATAKPKKPAAKKA
jgi:histone H1/5